MTQHTDLIERLYEESQNNPDDDRWRAANALEAQAREIAGLQAARMAYASEFPPDGEGEPDVGSIHQNIRAMKAEIERLRKDAERYEWLRDQANSVQHTAPLVFNAPGDGSRLQWTSALHGQALDDVLDAAIAMKGQP